MNPLDPIQVIQVIPFRASPCRENHLQQRAEPAGVQRGRHRPDPLQRGQLASAPDPVEVQGRPDLQQQGR